MKVSLRDFPGKGKLVKRDERYEVYDIAMEHLVASVTVLHAGKETTGHAHSEAEEIYYFAQGEGEILLDEKRLRVGEGDVVLIPKAAFHRVYNTGREDLIFLSIFEKYGDRK